MMQEASEPHRPVSSWERHHTATLQCQKREAGVAAAGRFSTPAGSREGLFLLGRAPWMLRPATWRAVAGTEMRGTGAGSTQRLLVFTDTMVFIRL